MSTGTTILIVALAGGGIWYVMRQQQQQQLLLAAAAAQQGGAGATGGGGIGGLVGGLFNQWKSDPLGIANAKAVVGGATSVVKNAYHEVSDLFGSIF